MLRDCKRRSTNLGMAWIGYRKVYDMIPHSWISESFEVFGVAENTKNFLLKSMNRWKLELTSNGVSLGNVEIRGGLFHSDSLSPLLFVLCMVPLSLILRSAKFHYEFRDKKTRIYYLLFMDDLKWFAKSKLMKTIDAEGYKYLGILEYDKVKEKEMKTEFVREF